MDQYLQAVSDALAAYRKPNPFGSDIFKSGLQVWHVPAATQRALSSTGYAFLASPAAEQRRIWRYIWQHADVLEVRLQCLWPLLRSEREECLRHWQDIQWFCARLDNWCEADYLASMVADCLEQDSERVLPVLRRWNRHADPWLRRQSLTGLFFYQRLRQRQPPWPVVTAHLEAQLAAPEHYVQKAVGWVLREAWQAYPRQLDTWLPQHLARVQPAALTTMLEKATAREKQQWRERHARARQ